MVSGSMVFGQDRSNVILFIVDDLGYYDISLTGSMLYETPHIDKLAESSARFINAYVSHPRCVPSRYSIQTGKFPARAQIPGGKGQMKLSELTIGEAFSEAGYTTFFAGKWHLGNKVERWPQNQGYDINIGGCSAGAPVSYYFPYNVDKDKSNKGKHREIIGLDDGVDGEYLSDYLTRKTVDFIQENAGHPFFAVLSHYGVHTPLQAKNEILDKYTLKLEGMEFSGPGYIAKDGTTKMHQDDAVYAAMIESIDESLGTLIKTLAKLEILEETIVIFTSDHGGLSNRGVNNNRRLATSNLPLRAGKGHVYEGGIKVPFYIYWPQGIKEGFETDQVTVNTDIYPTLLDLANIPMKEEQHLDGLSLLPALNRQKSRERKLYWHSPLGRPNSTGDENCSAIRSGNYKLIHYYDKDEIELFDLKNDPFENNNLAENEKRRSKSLLKELNEWKSKAGAFISNRKPISQTPTMK
jgi:arylsulfatase A-like enzyme